MKKILLLTTGGTIACEKTQNGLSPAITPDKLISYISIPKDVKIDTRQIMNIDSTNIQPEYWLNIVNAIKESYEQYDGFVITHGTDTMAYTASALSYLMQNLSKPVVITGAQHPINAEITDARKNLKDTLAFACQKGICGVYIVFDSKAILGTRARKVRSKSNSAFESINYPYAAFIDGTRITHYVLPKTSKKSPVFYEKITPKVFLLKLIPGMEPDVLDYIGDNYKGVVIESYGVGGLPFNDRRNFLEKLEKLSKGGKLVVIATQVMLEGSDLELYEVGMKALANKKVLQAYDMTVEAAVTKLMWIMSQTDDFKKAKKLFYSKISEDILI